MKKIILLTGLALTMTVICSYGEDNGTPPRKPSADSSIQHLKVDISLDTSLLKKLLPGTTAVQSTDFKGKPVEGADWLLVYSPVLLFFIALMVLRSLLNGFDVKDSLTENDFEKETVANPQYTAQSLLALQVSPALASDLPPTYELTTKVKSKSSSRYIALITSSFAWMICVALSSFFIYMYITTGKPPEISKISDVLLAMGVGVVPYAFNKVSDAIKK